MRARDWFEKIRADVLELREAERYVEQLSESCGPRGGLGGSGGATHSTSVMTPADRYAQAEIEFELRRLRLQPDLDRACSVLYGFDGRGGGGRTRGSAAPDSIHGYYLQGMTWAEVASELVRFESGDAAQWCRRTAARAFSYIDQVGMDYLADL